LYYSETGTPLAFSTVMQHCIDCLEYHVSENNKCNNGR